MISRIGRIRRIGLTPVVKRFALTTGRVGLIGLIGLIAVFAVGAKTADASALRKAPNNLGLVGYWSFEDATGTIATDFSGNGNTGTLTNMEAIDWVDGKIGKALDFDGSDERVSISLSSTHTFTTSDSFTFAGWINPDTVTGDNYLIQFNGPDLIHLYRTGTSARFRIRADEANLTTVTGGTLTIGSWYHLVGVRDVSVDKIILYVNGTQVASTTDAVTGTITTASYFLGNYQSTYTDGQIDEVRIYNRALSATEVGDLYERSAISKINSSQKNFLTDGLVGYWSFDGADISGVTAYDRSGQGNNGTITGAVSTIGKLGQALSFDGSGDYTTLPNTGFPNWWSNAPVSISVWIKTSASGVFLGNENATDEAPGNATGWVPAMYVDSGGYIRISLFWHGAVAQTVSTNIFDDNDWHHVVGIYNSGTETLYVDGVQEGQRTSLSQTDYASGDYRYFLGAGKALSWTNISGDPSYFTGSIDEARIYNRALSPSEVEVLYNAGATKFNVSPKTTLTDGLVGYWTFDGPDLTTTTSTDVSGNGNDGTANGDVKATIGKLGQGLRFGGSGDYIKVLHSASILSAKDTMTVTFWFKTDDLSGYHSLVSKGTSNTATSEAFDILTSEDEFYYRTVASESASNSNSSTANLSAAQWYFVAATYSTSEKKLYLDGQAVIDLDGSGELDMDEGDMYIASQPTGSTNNFSGLIDELRIYSRVLSDSEIRKLYNMGK